MPYEDDYKAWLEKMLIKMNPDWVCDGMTGKEFTHDWCEKYCGKDSHYITPKCLHMFYHHIARADRKTENSSEKPNNCESQNGYQTFHGTSVYVSRFEDEPQRDCEKCKWWFGYCHFFGECDYEPKDEPQTETEIAKAIVHKMIDDAVIAEDAYPDLRQKMHDAVDEYEPQTERSSE